MSEFTAFLSIESVAVVCAVGMASEALRRGRMGKAVGTVAVITGVASLLVLALLRSYAPVDLAFANPRPQPVATSTASASVAGEIKVPPPTKPSVRHIKRIVGGHTVFQVAPPTGSLPVPNPQPPTHGPASSHSPNPHPSPTHPHSPTPTPTSPSPTPTSPSPTPTSPSPTPTSPSPSDTETPSPSDTGSPSASPA